MSLILEALKKSEAERRLGQAPTLATTSEFVVSRRTKRWRLFLLAAGTLIAAAVAVAVLSIFFDGPAPAVETAPHPANLGAVTAVSTPRPEASSRPKRTVGSTAGPTDAVAASPSGPAQVSASRDRTTSAPTSADGAEERLPRAVEFDSVERESMPVAATELPGPPPPAAGLQSTAGSRQHESVSASSHARDAAAQVDPSSGSEKETRPDWVRVEYLPTQERGALPPLKVSMHVFAEIPSARFVLIDGRRLVEGDRIDGSLQVIEIRREGTVLEHEGRRLLLARP